MSENSALASVHNICFIVAVGHLYLRKSIVNSEIRKMYVIVFIFLWFFNVAFGEVSVRVNWSKLIQVFQGSVIW